MEIFSRNRIGQYSKYLERNPIFATYYHASEVFSTRDTGTGNVSDIVGKNSPFRYNKILNFPLYNFPEFKPNLDYDPSTGIDIEMDISDITILPNTIKPRENDLILILLPNSVQMLFRVNNIRYNTIQSNDFYQVDCDIYKLGGPDNEFSGLTIEQIVDKQVTEIYYTIFDNIGTDDKCFIRDTDRDKIKQLAALIIDLRNIYKENYYHKVTNTFLCDRNISCEIHPYYYDHYVEKFITDSNIFYDPYSTGNIVLTPQVILPNNFERQFRRTLLYAVLSKSNKYLDPYMYSYNSDLVLRFSSFMVFDVEVESPNLVSTGKVQAPNRPQIMDGVVTPYFNCALMTDIKTGDYHGNNDYTVFEKMIFDYIKGNTLTIDHEEVSNEALSDNLTNYMHLPMVIYILMKTYDGYFQKLDEDMVK